MSETNGKNGVAKSGEKGPDRDAKGRLLPGHSVPGPGRPIGSLDFMAVIRAEAKASKRSLDLVIVEAFDSLIKQVDKGDVPAIKLLLDRMCGVMDKGPVVAMQINDANTVNIAEQGRADLKVMAGEDDSQAIVLDELERRTSE